jgi:hypothetical protein
MLEPQERRQLLDCLRPPEDYSLDAAVGTTYSLDLLALLTAPVAFTFFDWENEAGQPTANPHALLAAIRRNADRMALFCQAGGIHIPSGDKRLYNYLEDSVFQAMPQDPRGPFIPKFGFSATPLLHNRSTTASSVSAAILLLTDLGIRRSCWKALFKIESGPMPGTARLANFFPCCLN